MEKGNWTNKGISVEQYPNHLILSYLSLPLTYTRFHVKAHFFLETFTRKVNQILKTCLTWVWRPCVLQTGTKLVFGWSRWLNMFFCSGIERHVERLEVHVLSVARSTKETREKNKATKIMKILNNFYQLYVGLCSERLWPRNWKCCPRLAATGNISKPSVTVFFFNNAGLQAGK